MLQTADSAHAQEVSDLRTSIAVAQAAAKATVSTSALEVQQLQTALAGVRAQLATSQTAAATAAAAQANGRTAFESNFDADEAATAAAAALAERDAAHTRRASALEAQLREARDLATALQVEVDTAQRKPRPAFQDVKRAAEDVLARLGVESWRDERLGLGKKVDREGVLLPGEALESRMEAGGMLPVARGRTGDDAPRGQLSVRFWLVAVYLVLMHFFIMLQFTSRRGLSCADGLPGGATGDPRLVLPGR